MKGFILFLAMFVSRVCCAGVPIDIVVWHSLSGHLGDEFNRLVRGFNHQQNEYKLKLVYKGEYTDSLTSFAAAFRAKNPPDLVQVFEVGTAVMLSPKGIIKPLAELMHEQGLSLPTQDFLPAVNNFYSVGGRLQAMPFNISVPVMFYNADRLALFGINKDNFPKTWQEIESLAVKLKKAGQSCVYTSSYPSWIQIESFSALHGLVYSNRAITQHLKRLKKWQAADIFEYGGRASDATVLFTSGRCVLFSQSSGSYQSLKALVKFKVGVAPLPLDSLVQKQRYTNVVGGAALWTIAGKSTQVYRGVALFYQYLAQPKIQQQWHQNTGYIPIGLKGVYSAFAQETNQPTLSIAKQDLETAKFPPFNTSQIPQNQIRMINDEALEAIFAGLKSPEQAMQDAVLRADFALKRFARNTQE